jgi:hypothetical protein
MKRTTPWQSAGEILSSRRRRGREDPSAGTLRALLRRSARMERLNHQVRAALPHDVRDHCRVTALENGELRLIADSSVWATRLRFESPRLKETLRQLSDFRTIDRIQIRAGRTPAPAMYSSASDSSSRGLPDRSSAPGQHRWTQIGADCVRTCAEQLEDRELRSALSRLASHLDP